MASRALSPLQLGRFLHVLDEGMVTALVWHLPEMFSTLQLLLSQLKEEGAHVLHSYNLMVEIGAQREVSVEGWQKHVEQAADGGGLHMNGIILTNLGAHG